MNYFRSQIQADVRRRQKSYEHRQRRSAAAAGQGDGVFCPICGAESTHPLLIQRCVFCGSVLPEKKIIHPRDLPGEDAG